MTRILLWTIALASMPLLWAAPWHGRPHPPTQPVQATPRVETATAPRWRRTVSGWEDARSWQRKRQTPIVIAPPSSVPDNSNFAAHPLVFAGWIVVLSLAAMKTWPASLKRVKRSPTAPRAPKATMVTHEPCAA